MPENTLRHRVMVCRGAAAGPAGILGPVPYTVSTPVFEGPFDLLLHLITREQVDLWEVSLSAIVDGYVATLEHMRAALDLEVATEFLLIAAVLLELKARRLLPGRDDVELEEELALWEERDLLLARLLECKTFKDAAGAMQRLMDAAGLSWPRAAGARRAFRRPRARPARGRDGPKLRDTLQALLAPKPGTRLLLDHVAPVRISVRDAVEELIDELPRAGRISFSRLTGDLAERLEVIVRFLALLELYKQGLVDLEQASSLAELHVYWLGPEIGLPTPARSTSRNTRGSGDGVRDPTCHRGHRDGGRPARRAAPPGPVAGGVAGPGGGAVRRVGGVVPRRGPRLLAGAGGGRVPLPEPRRPGALCRALPPRGPDGPPVRGRPGDPGHRRLQAAGLPGPDRGPSGASTPTG